MFKMKRKKVRFFNLVEIVLAIAVLTVGIAAVMSLVPVGLNSYRDAMADNDGAQNAETMLREMENYFTKDKASFANLLNTAIIPVKKGGKPNNNVVNGDMLTEVTGWTAKGSNGLYEVSGSVPGLYGFASPNLAKADFIAHALVWRDDIYVLEWKAGAWAVKQDASSQPLKSTDVVRLNVELSWPVAKPYERREKRLFTLEIYNKNAN